MGLGDGAKGEPRPSRGGLSPELDHLAEREPAPGQQPVDRSAGRCAAPRAAGAALPAASGSAPGAARALPGLPARPPSCPGCLLHRPIHPFRSMPRGLTAPSRPVNPWNDAGLIDSRGHGAAALRDPHHGRARPADRAPGDRSVDGVQIAVRELRPPRPTAGVDPVILLHGARVPGLGSFDLPGASLAEDLAVRTGARVYVPDSRGYGRSDRPPAMSRPAEESRPLSRSFEVVRDVDAVVRAVLARTGRGRSPSSAGRPEGCGPASTRRSGPSA